VVDVTGSGLFPTAKLRVLAILIFGLLSFSIYSSPVLGTKSTSKTGSAMMQSGRHLNARILLSVIHILKSGTPCKILYIHSYLVFGIGALLCWQRSNTEV
jgi:hypothetical protein